MIKNYNDYILYDIDSSDNNIIWQKNFINQTQNTFHVSNNGIVILGEKYYLDTIDVDPSSNLYNISGDFRFILFLNLDGTFSDVKLFHKPSTSDIIFNTLTTDVFGNYFFGGSFGDIVDFDPSNNTNNIIAGYFGDAFYLKLDANRNFDNLIKFGQELPLISPYNICHTLRIKKIKVVNNNNYLIGEFNRVCDFDPSINSSQSLHSINSGTYNLDGFIQKLGPCNSSMPTANNIQSFCSSQNPKISNLTPNSDSIKWYDSLTSTNPLNNSISLIDGQIYYASRQVASCPESPRLTVTVSIIQSALSPIATNQIFCENENATIANLIASGQNLKWYLNQTSTNSLPLSSVLENNINYFVSQTINGCESNKTQITVTITSVAIPTLTSPQNFCIQQNATLNSIVITGQNIKWYDALTNGNLLLNSTALINGTTYYASQTLNNCESNRVALTVNIQDTAVPNGTNQSFCASQNATLNNIVVAGTNINWYTTNTSTTILPSSTILANNVTYYGTQTVNNCESVTRLPITITLINTLNANNFAVEFCDDLNNGSEVANLNTYNSILISNTTNCTFVYYNSFIGATNQTATDQITNTNYTMVTGLKTIFVRITSTNGCHQIVELKLTLQPKPLLTIKDIEPICENSSITIYGDLGYDDYTWSTGEKTTSITINNSGDYFLTVIKNYATINCSTTKNFKVVKSNAATISEIITSDWTANDNSITIVVTTSSIGDYEYSLDGTNYQSSNVFSGLNSGEYDIFIRDKNGCGNIKDEVYLLMYPKFFTPNGDGFNDQWKIKFSNGEANLKIKIFDRFGKLLKDLDNNANGWDGTFNGQELPSTDYWFTVMRANGKEYKGHFAMKR